jgi:hypothetical protein
MQLIGGLLSTVYLNMFLATLCPSSGEKDCEMPHVVLNAGCACRGRAEQGRELSALTESCFSKNHTIAHPVLNTTGGVSHSCSPDGGHNSARNMLR